MLTQQGVGECTNTVLTIKKKEGGDSFSPPLIFVSFGIREQSVVVTPRPFP